MAATMTMTAAIIINILETMTRDHLRDVAQSLNVSVGKSKQDTITNLAGAIEQNKGRMVIQVGIKPPYEDPSNPNVNMPFIFLKRVYSYKPEVVQLTPTDGVDV